jgi:hypothetical protein
MEGHDRRHSKRSMRAVAPFDQRMRHCAYRDTPDLDFLRNRGSGQGAPVAPTPFPAAAYRALGG